MASIGPASVEQTLIGPSLPDGWVERPLGSLLEPNGLFDGPFGSNLKTSDYTDSGVRVIRLENVGHLRFVGEKRVFISSQKYSSLTKHTVSEGDIIFGSFVEDNVRVCLLPRLDTPAIAKADCYCVRPKRDLVDPRFLAFQMATSRVRDELISHVHGATRPRITTRQLRDVPVLLCHLPEQRRIVTKVEALLARVNAAHDRLARVPAILKRFRQSVLAAACSGRLTDQWREQRPDSGSSAELVEHVITERQVAYRESVHEAVASGSRRPQGPKNLRRTAPDPEPTEELPPSWAWVSFNDLCDDITVGHVGPMTNEYVECGVPFLRSLNVEPFRFNPQSLKYISERFHRLHLKSRLSPGDVVVVRTGNPGTACVVPDSLVDANCADLVVVRPSRALDPEFACVFMNSSTALRHVEGMKVGIAQGHFNVGSMRTTAIPLPPLPEQREIVRRVHALFALADTIEQRATTALRRADRLTQSILSKAFRGELVGPERSCLSPHGQRVPSGRGNL